MTSRDEILATCREIVSNEGLSALSMRRVAQDCGVALGSLYHYFPSKDGMVTATVESIWHDIFHMDQQKTAPSSFPDYISWLFSCVRETTGKYPDFFVAHSMNFASSAKAEARSTMMRCFSHMEHGLLASLVADPDVSLSAFSDSFAREDFVGLVFSAFLSSLAKGDETCDVLTEVIRRVIYR